MEKVCDDDINKSINQELVNILQGKKSIRVKLNKERDKTRDNKLDES